MNPDANYGKKKPKAAPRGDYHAVPPSQDKLDKVLEILGRKGELSRAHLSGFSGYDVSTVSKVISHLGDKVTRRTFERGLF